MLGLIGPKAEAQQVKESLETFLQDSLKLELSREKTLITHATSQAARFLGYELVNQQANDQFDRNGRRRVNGQIGLRVPADVIEQHCQVYMRKGKPAHRSYLLHDEDFGIVAMSREKAKFSYRWKPAVIQWWATSRGRLVRVEETGDPCGRPTTPARSDIHWPTT